MNGLEGRHPGVRAVAELFEFKELTASTRDHIDEVREACVVFAQQMLDELPDGPELTAGLRKLLEAKDCFVRALL